MKYSTLLLAFTVLFCACRQADKNNNQPPEPGTSVPPAASIQPTTATTDMHYLWSAELDSTSGKTKMKKSEPLPPDSLNSGFIVQHLNKLYPEIPLVFDKISHDTIFVKIIKAHYLTEQIGSTGADMYMTEATYNLSELKNISYVHFDFKEGDHAGPGTYAKTDFVNVLK